MLQASAGDLQQIVTSLPTMQKKRMARGHSKQLSWEDATQGCYKTRKGITFEQCLQCLVCWLYLSSVSRLLWSLAQISGVPCTPQGMGPAILVSHCFRFATP